MRPPWTFLASSNAPISFSGRRERSYGCPLTSALPDVGRSSPRIMRIVVDLPAPLGPRKPVTTPGRTVNDRSSTATLSPNLLVSERASITTGLPSGVAICPCNDLPTSEAAGMSAGAERRADMPCAIQIAGSIRPAPRYADLVRRTTGNPSSDPPIASAMAHLPPRTVSRWRSVFASVIETAFIESHAGAGISRTRSRPNWSISRCRSGCSSGFQPSSSSRRLSHRAATTRS